MLHRTGTAFKNAALTTYAPFVQVRSRYAAAVQAAVEAYARTDHMLDAALAYAAHGYPVFPLSHKKRPIPARDKDINGKPIQGTGGFKKATTDEVVIHKWWHGREYLIGMPMGPAVGVFALDIDTSEDHADGMIEWKTITAEHGAIDTREHRTATGGLHLILKWHHDRQIGCSRGSLPDGIDVKGRGGYIVMPPSRRKGRNYNVGNDIDPIDPPDWLIEMIGTRPAPTFKRVNSDRAAVDRGDGKTNEADSARFSFDIPADLAELASAADSVPNNDLPWDEWTTFALALFAATTGRGFAIFDRWSSKSKKYDPAVTRDRWEEICGSPPDRMGAQYIYNLARANGWLRRTTPTYAPASFSDLEAARHEVRRIAGEFLNRPRW